jgi:hypothetical protein
MIPHTQAELFFESIVRVFYILTYIQSSLQNAKNEK